MAQYEVKKKEDNQNTFPRNVILALITVQIIFGLNFVISKSIVNSIPGIVWANIRVAISTFLLFGIAIVLKRPAPPINFSFLCLLFFYSILGVTINQGAFLVGLGLTSSTNSAVLSTLIPIFTLVLVTITGKEPFTLKKGVGFFIALCGVLAIRKVENFSFSNQAFMGDLLIILNCLSYSIFLTVSKKRLEKLDPIWITAWLFLLGNIGLTLLSFNHWKTLTFPTIDLSLGLSMLYSILGSTLLAYLLNQWALTRVKSSSVAFFIYLQPIITTFTAWIWKSEEITYRTLISTFLIFLGMILALNSKKSSKEDLMFK